MEQLFGETKKNPFIGRWLNADGNNRAEQRKQNLGKLNNGSAKIEAF